MPGTYTEREIFVENTTVFTLHYSASQNQEVAAIRNKYLPQPESKLEELKRLDRAVQTAGILQGLTIGIIGCLVFGLGMCLAMQVIGSNVIFGIFLGICGALLITAAHPVYHAAFSKAKAQHAPRILQLAAELSDAKS